MTEYHVEIKGTIFNEKHEVKYIIPAPSAERAKEWGERQAKHSAIEKPKVSATELTADAAIALRKERGDQTEQPQETKKSAKKQKEKGLVSPKASIKEAVK